MSTSMCGRPLLHFLWERAMPAEIQSAKGFAGMD